LTGWPWLLPWRQTHLQQAPRSAWGRSLAVILHKPFGALAIITLMAVSGSTRKSRHFVNLAFALVTPLGALLFYFGDGSLGTRKSRLAGVGPSVLRRHLSGHCLRRPAA